MITATETKLPKIKTALPGPKAKEVIAYDAKYMSPSLTRDYPLVAERASGAIVEDPDGNTFGTATRRWWRPFRNRPPN